MIAVMKQSISKRKSRYYDDEDAFSVLSVSSSGSKDSYDYIEVPRFKTQLSDNLDEKILLNPGLKYHIRERDIIFYISLEKEENIDLKDFQKKRSKT